MKNPALLLAALLITVNTSFAQKQKSDPPSAEISNGMATMKLYLPDKDNGYYRATRFDWSGVIASLKWKGHEFFGQWKSTHDPLVHEDLSGPVEASVGPGMGYEEAPAGGTFVRLGVGECEKPDNKEFEWAHTYKIVNNGTWKVDQGKGWIEFTQTLTTKNGWGYIYTKRIYLKPVAPGFIISHTLKNTGAKAIKIDFFNHNFFMIDHDSTGRDFVVKFPYNITTDSDTKGIVRVGNKELVFLKDLKKGSIWLELKGYSSDIKDHGFTVMNLKDKVGVHVHVDKPLYKQVFWACPSTLCPENYIFLDVAPGKEEKWNSDYTLFEFK